MHSYDDNYLKFTTGDVKPCKFFEQSTCVASLQNEYDENEDFSVGVNKV